VQISLLFPIGGGLIYGWVKKGFVFYLKSAGVTLIVLIVLSLIIAASLYPKFAFLIARILAVVLCLVFVFIMVIYLHPTFPFPGAGGPL